MLDFILSLYQFSENELVPLNSLKVVNDGFSSYNFFLTFLLSINEHS